MTNSTSIGGAIIFAAFVHGFMTGTGPEVVRMSDFTYLLRYVNATYHCDVTKLPACRPLVEKFEPK